MSVEQFPIKLPTALWTGIGNRLVSTFLVAVARPTLRVRRRILLSQITRHRLQLCANVVNHGGYSPLPSETSLIRKMDEDMVALAASDTADNQRVVRRHRARHTKSRNGCYPCKFRRVKVRPDLLILPTTC
jgi:hypothetical protein